MNNIFLLDESFHVFSFLPPATTFNATYLLRLQQETYTYIRKEKETEIVCSTKVHFISSS